MIHTQNLLFVTFNSLFLTNFCFFKIFLLAKLLLALQLNCVSMSESVFLLGIFSSDAYCLTTMVLVILLNHSIIVKNNFKSFNLYL